jgi:hypothetical protein
VQRGASVRNFSINFADGNLAVDIEPPPVAGLHIPNAAWIARPDAKHSSQQFGRL